MGLGLLSIYLNLKWKQNDFLKHILIIYELVKCKLIRWHGNIDCARSAQIFFFEHRRPILTQEKPCSVPHKRAILKMYCDGPERKDFNSGPYMWLLSANGPSHTDGHRCSTTAMWFCKDYCYVGIITANFNCLIFRRISCICVIFVVVHNTL